MTKYSKTFSQSTSQSIPEPPPELADKRCWLVWHLEIVQNANGPYWKKIPYQPATGYQAKVTNPKHWGTFEQARARLKYCKFNGPGIVLTDGLCGADFDDCRDPDSGVIEDWAMQEIERLNSYCEISPSGTGLHVLCWGELPGDGINRPWNDHKIELYDRGLRYFTFTGVTVDPWTTIARRDVEIVDLYNRVVKATTKRKPTQQAPKATFKPPILTLSDEEILEHAKVNPKFDALYSGSIAGYKSHSEADMGLVNLLCYWTPDDQQVCRLWLSSGLYRAKLERADYVTRTINTSRASQTRCNWKTEHCEPEPEPEAEPPDEDKEPWESADPERQRLLRKILDSRSKMLAVSMMVIRTLDLADIPSKAWRLIVTIHSFCRGSLRVRKISNEMLAERAHISVSSIRRAKELLWEYQRKSGITLIRYWPGSMDMQTGERYLSRYQSNLDRWCLMALDQAIEANGEYPRDEHLAAAVAVVAMTIPRNPVPDPETEPRVKKEPDEVSKELSAERRFNDAVADLHIIWSQMNIGYAQKRRKAGSLVVGAFIKWLEINPDAAREIVKETLDEIDPDGDARDFWESVS
jgi:putative DNA primase/helicase